MRRWWPLLKVLAAGAVLVALVARVGAGTFLEALRAVDVGSVLAALGIGLLTAVLSAGRWWVVARGLGVALTPARALADTYRALFLNSVLPAGVLGDVHRAVHHGRRGGGAGARAVVLERVAGQAVVVAVGVAVLLASPVPFPDGVPVAGVVGAAVVAGALAVLAARGRWAARVRSGVRAVLVDVRAGLGSRWLAVVLLSMAGLAGHLALFVVAARTAGSQAPLAELLPLLVAALLAMIVPINIGGWGPREAVAAAVFGATGYGVAQGVAVAVVFGVLGLVACLPGAVVVLRTAAAPARPSVAPC